MSGEKTEGKRFTILELPGSGNLKIATSDAKNETTTPEWMVNINNLTHSATLNYEAYTRLIGWNGEETRENKPDLSDSQLKTSASIKSSEIVLLVANSGYIIALEESMRQGKPLDVVSIVRLGSIQNSNVPLQMIDFTVCYIHSLQQVGKDLKISFIPSAKKNTVYVYGPDGGSQGQLVSNFDYSKNQAT